MARKCAHCGAEFETNGTGRGAYQPRKKFCTVACKNAARKAARQYVVRAVACPRCGEKRELITPGVQGKSCRRCAARAGSVAAARANTRDVEERFLAFVQKSASAPCWVWTGTRQRNGYGSFGVKGRTLRAHRWSYEFYVGPIPAGLQIDHLCRVRNCVNPEHLEPVTHAENMRRAREARI